MKSRSSSIGLLINISRYSLALLFLFSGLAKAINPFGLSIQFGEYFSAMGLEFLTPCSGLFSVLLPSVETALGLMLLGGLFMRFTSIVVGVFMFFFTGLTLWIALYNPVSDCGCFGDLFKISNWQTFTKNLIFLIPTIFLLSARYAQSAGYVGVKMVGVVILSLWLPLYSLMNLPLIDATPFKIGVSIPRAMTLEPGAAQDQIETTLIYKNRHTQQLMEFSVTDTTWYDSDTWEYVDSRSRVLSEGATPEISSFALIDRLGDDQHSVILASPEILLVITNDLSTVDFEYIYQLMSQGSRVALLTSQSLTQVPSDIEAYNSDFTLNRTMIQYPMGGAMLLEEGVIRMKWTMDQLPRTLKK